MPVASSSKRTYDEMQVDDDQYPIPAPRPTITADNRAYVKAPYAHLSESVDLSTVVMPLRQPLHHIKTWSGRKPNDDKAPTGHLWEIPLPYKRAVKWPNYAACVAFNTDYLPAPPLPETAFTYIGTDGNWGRREYTLEPQYFDHLSPHLAFLPVPQTLGDYAHTLFRPPTKDDAIHSSDTSSQLIFTRFNRDRWCFVVNMARDGARVCKAWIARILSDFPHLKADNGGRTKMFFSCRYPSGIEASMLKLYDILDTRGVASYKEFRLVWSSLQRMAREMVAYVSFCAQLIPSTTAREEIQRYTLVEEMPRRGCLFGGADLIHFLGVFVSINLPAYAVISRALFVVEHLTPSSPVRSSTEVDSTMSMYSLLPPC
jgi:hypothetical protein